MCFRLTNFKKTDFSDNICSILTFTNKFFTFLLFIVDIEVEAGFQEESKAQKYLLYFISRRNFAMQS